jgi:uroporphyrinogen decarboxylase
MTTQHGPDFDNYLTALHCEEPKRVPLSEFNIDPSLMDQFMGKPVKTLQDLVDFRVVAGFDFVVGTSGMFELFGKAGGIGTSSAKSQTSSGDERKRDWANEHEGVITNWEQFEKFQWPSAEDFAMSQWETFDKILPKGMKAVLALGKIYTPVWMLMGLATFFDALKFNESLVEALFEKVGKIQFETCLKVIEHPCIGAVFNPDDIAHNTGMLIDPKYLRKYLFPWYKKMGDVCKDKGLGYIFHSDGDNTEIMDDLVEAGYHGFNPVQPNCMDIEEVKKKWGKKLCLIGNINLDSTLTLGTPEDVRAEVYERIRTIGPGGGYMVCSSNSIPDYVPLENMKAMLSAAKEFGTYPLHLEKGKVEGTIWTYLGKQTLKQDNNSTDASVIDEYIKVMVKKDVDGLIGLAKNDLEDGVSFPEVINDKLIPSMKVIGDQFQNGEVFIPEMMMAAQAMAAAISHFEDHLSSGASEKVGKVVIGTVKGDLHDIGKNLVIMMLQGQGYEVHDLGVSITEETFVQAINEHKPDILAMSALLTTTMVEMKKNIATLVDKGLRDSVKIIVGGAPMTQKFADEIGADGYAYDAAGAAQVCNSLIAG